MTANAPHSVYRRAPFARGNCRGVGLAPDWPERPRRPIHRSWDFWSEEGLMPANHVVDYYEILQISPNAEPETVHRVFRLLAQRCHPDNAETGNE